MTGITYEKKDWQRSEGQYHTYGRESREKEKKLSAYHPSDREKTKKNRPNEMLTMENSFGGISIGANRSRKLTMVVHEKKRFHGPGLRKDHCLVEGNQTTSISGLRGEFRTNSHCSKESAFIYEEKAEESPIRMMKQLQELMDENRQESGERVLPFLNRKDRPEYEPGSRHMAAFKTEETEKAELRRRFYRELLFAREKSKRLMHEESSFFLHIPETAVQTLDNGAVEELPEESETSNSSQDIYQKEKNNT